MKREDVQDVAKLLEIRSAFLLRNRNLVYGLVRFLVGPLLALIVSHETVQYVNKKEKGRKEKERARKRKKGGKKEKEIKGKEVFCLPPPQQKSCIWLGEIFGWPSFDTHCFT